MIYQHEATSLEGFVQQVVRYVGAGNRYYVVGQVREGKTPEAIDRLMMEKFSVEKTVKQRYRAKQRGEAAVHYLRYSRNWLLLATKGRHRFFEEHTDAGGAKRYSDIQRIALRAGPYALSSKLDGQWKPGQQRRYRVRVTLTRETYKELLAYYSEVAAHWRVEKLVEEVAKLGKRYMPYKPVRSELLRIVRRMNETRKDMGYQRIPYEALQMAPHVKPVKVFRSASRDAA